MAKKVLRYTEEEFVTLLENIVKRVKKEQMLEESRKSRTNRLDGNPNRRSNNYPSNRTRPNSRRK